MCVSLQYLLICLELPNLCGWDLLLCQLIGLLIDLSLIFVFGLCDCFLLGLQSSMSILQKQHLLSLLHHRTISQWRIMRLLMPFFDILRYHIDLLSLFWSLQNLLIKVLLSQLRHWLPKQRILLQLLSTWYLREPQHFSMCHLHFSLRVMRLR